jgi:hypothetical protein
MTTREDIESLSVAKSINNYGDVIKSVLLSHEDRIAKLERDSALLRGERPVSRVSRYYKYNSNYCSYFGEGVYRCKTDSGQRGDFVAIGEDGAEFLRPVSIFWNMLNEVVKKETTTTEWVRV